MKTKAIVIRVTEEQDLTIIARAKEMGFQQKSDYVRYVLFLQKSIEGKIDEIYEKVVKKNG